jgi:hypothetical protein
VEVGHAQDALVDDREGDLGAGDRLPLSFTSIVTVTSSRGS